MENMWSNVKIATNRRSFLKNGLAAAGAATAGMGLLTESASASANDGFDDDRGERLTRGDAALLRFAAGDPENIGERRQRMRRRVGIGALGVVDEQHISAAADLLHAVREAGEAAQAVLQDFG